MLIRPLVEDLFDPFLDLNGKAGICSAGRDRDLHDAVTNSCGYQEITLGQAIGYIDWYSQAFGGSSHAPVHGTIVGGGLTPYLATYLISKTDNLLMPGFLLIGAAVLALVTLTTVRESSKDALL